MPSTLLERIFHRARKVIVSENMAPANIATPVVAIISKEERLANLVRQSAAHTSPSVQPKETLLPTLPTIQAPAEPEKDQPKPIEEIAAPINEEIVAVTENLEVKVGEKLYEGKINERRLLLLFFNELNELFILGNHLDEDMKLREIHLESTSEAEKKDGYFNRKAAEIQDEIKKFKDEQGEASMKTYLNSATTAIEQYLSDLQSEVEKRLLGERKSSNALSLQIEKKKKEVKDLISKIGGMENYKKIKDGINFAEKVGRRGKAKSIEANVGEPTVLMVNNAVISGVAANPAGLQMLVEGSATPKLIIDILIDIFNPEQNTKIN